MDKYKIIYEYTYDFYDGYTFKKQICIDNNKKIIFNFIVNDLFCDDLLLSNISNDFKDSTLNNKIKEYLLNDIKEKVKFKTLGICLKGIKCNIQMFESGIRINDKVFKLKNNDYGKLKTKLLDYIDTLKHQQKILGVLI